MDILESAVLCVLTLSGVGLWFWYLKYSLTLEITRRTDVMATTLDRRVGQYEKEIEGLTLQVRQIMAGVQKTADEASEFLAHQSLNQAGEITDEENELRSLAEEIKSWGKPALEKHATISEYEKLPTRLSKETLGGLRSVLNHE